MAEENKHALLSPSKAVRWLSCPGSIALESTVPRRHSSSAAEEGTTAHELAEICLTTCDACPAAYIGTAMTNGWEVTEDMAVDVAKYVDFVKGLACSKGDVILVEQKLDISWLTGEDDAEGTADAVVMVPDELIVVDLKFGKGHVVEAEDNPQLIIYALAARRQMELLHDFGTVRVIIHQPRREHVVEAVYTNEELDAHVERISEGAEAVWEELSRHSNGEKELNLNPSEKACQWCNAKAVCPKLAKSVETITEVHFDPIPEDTDNAPSLLLSTRRAMVGLVRQWCDAIEDEVERELKAGNTVPGWKLVIGRKGNRAWLDEEEAEKLLKAAKLKKEEMYTTKLVSPAALDKMVKEDRFGERMLRKIESVIVSPEGKPTVVPASDKRQAVDVQKVDFENLDAN